jgi:two-component system, sensor histidine kinase
VARLRPSVRQFKWIGAVPETARIASARATDRHMQSVPADLARGALDAAPDAMIIIDAAGIIRFASRRVSDLFGYSHEEVIGRNIESLMPERFRTRHAEHRRVYVETPRTRPMGLNLALFGQRRDGSEFPVEISLSPIQDGERSLVAAAIRDATIRKRVEAELEEARESAVRAGQAKSRFLATASHDLRQPLQTLALLNGALRRIVKEVDATEVLSQQEQAIGAMSRLLNALLDISKIESGAVKPALSDFKVATLLEGLRREFGSLAVAKGLELQVQSTEDFAHSDPSLVEQLLKNLVSNAVKYTREGRVLLRARRHSDSVRIEVQDTGVGIPADQIAYIYDEFYQVGVPANSSRDGYGLGLSIVQRLVKLLGLRLEVTSEVGAGSVFSLVLPLGASLAAAGEPLVPAPAPLSTGTGSVLLVEDDPGVRDATRMLLKVEGYRVTAVASLAEALRAMSEEAADLLITDYHLRDGELGTEVITRLRARWGADLKAVLITGDTSAVVKELSGDPHLRVTSKPVDAEELLTLLQELLAS